MSEIIAAVFPTTTITRWDDFLLDMPRAAPYARPVAESSGAHSQLPTSIPTWRCGQTKLALRLRLDHNAEHVGFDALGHAGTLSAAEQAAHVAPGPDAEHLGSDLSNSTASFRLHRGRTVDGSFEPAELLAFVGGGEHWGCLNRTGEEGELQCFSIVQSVAPWPLGALGADGPQPRVHLSLGANGGEMESIGCSDRAWTLSAAVSSATHSVATCEVRAPFVVARASLAEALGVLGGQPLEQ